MCQHVLAGRGDKDEVGPFLQLLVQDHVPLLPLRREVRSAVFFRPGPVPFVAVGEVVELSADAVRDRARTRCDLQLLAVDEMLRPVCQHHGDIGELL